MSTRRRKPPEDTGEVQLIVTPIDEVAMQPPSRPVPLPEVRQRNRHNMFNTELLLEAAKPEYEATSYEDLIKLAGYEHSSALRTRISQLVNKEQLDEKFRPPAPKRGKK